MKLLVFFIPCTVVPLVVMRPVPLSTFTTGAWEAAAGSGALVERAGTANAASCARVKY